MLCRRPITRRTADLRRASAWVLISRSGSRWALWMLAGMRSARGTEMASRSVLSSLFAVRYPSVPSLSHALLHIMHLLAFPHHFLGLLLTSSLLFSSSEHRIV